jgi:hypothetical protein
MKVLNFTTAAVVSEQQRAQITDASRRFAQALKDGAGALVQGHLDKPVDEMEAAAEAFVQRTFDTSFAAVTSTGEQWHTAVQTKASIVAALVALRAQTLRFNSILPKAVRQAQADAWACLARNVRAGNNEVLTKFEALGRTATASALMGNEDLPAEIKTNLEREIWAALGSVLNSREEVLERARAAVAAQEAAQAHRDEEREQAARVFAQAGIQAPASITAMTADLRAEWATAVGLADHAPQFALDTSLSTPEAAQRAIVAAHEIKFLGEMTRLPTVAAGLIRNRQTPAAARAVLQDALAEADEALHIENARHVARLKPAAGSEVSVFAIYDRFNGRKQA